MLPMLRIRARKLLAFTTAELWEKLEGDFILVFDDGEVLTNEREVIYSSYTWDYHREFPETPLLLKHHVSHVTAKQRAGTNTHLQLMENELNTVYDTYRNQVSDRTALMDRLALLSYEISNVMYNELTINCEPYVTGLDITDFTAITTSPRVKEALDTMEPTEAGIVGVYATIKDVLQNDPVLKFNPVANALNAKLSSEGQTLQCLGPRGFLTDVDSHVFKIPVKRGYAAGITDMYSSLVESRSATKSMAFSTEPLQKSEYFSRRQQLICMNVQNLHMCDCGSKNYLTWHMRDARMQGATKVKSDLLTLEGKYYLDESTQTLKTIKANDYHLLGKTLRIRSIVAGCQHPDPYGVCEVCYGELSTSVPAGSNLGHLACVTMTSELGQNILSTKHFDGSSAVEGIVLKPHEKRFFTAAINSNTYYLNPELKGSTVQLIVASSQAMGLADVQLVDDVTTLNIGRVSEFEDILIHVSDKKGSELNSPKVSVNGRLSNMTHELLAHIKLKGWGVTEKDDYVIDMDGWDYSKPLLVLPMRHFNMSDHQGEIADMLEATMKDLEYRSSIVNPCNMLIELHDLVNRRLSVNLAILEVILYSSMIVSATENDYSLPKPWTSNGVGVKQTLLTERSLGPTMGYERHRDVLKNPTSYTRTNRPDHGMDILLIPQILNNRTKVMPAMI